MEFNHYRHERSLLDFQRNAVFNTLNDQSKSVYSYSLISLLKALLYAQQRASICTAGNKYSPYSYSIPHSSMQVAKPFNSTEGLRVYKLSRDRMTDVNFFSSRIYDEQEGH
jgi:hypothetical protein